MGIQAGGYIRAGNTYLEYCQWDIAPLTMVRINLARRTIGFTGAGKRDGLVPGRRGFHGVVLLHVH